MKRFFIAVALLVMLVASVFVAWRLLPLGQTYYTDASTIREPAATALVRDILWEPPVPLAEPINVGGETYEPRLSNDGTTLYFVRGKAGGNADIFLTRRTPQGWSDPQPMTEVNSPADDLGPEFSADGESLYFYSNRAGGQGGYDLWVSRRGTDSLWREPTNLGPQVNSQFNDYGPALAPDARTLFFSSNRPQPGDEREPDPSAWPATLREEFYTRTYDLYSAALTASGSGEARPLAALNTPHNEGALAVSSFGDFLYFASDRPGGSGGFDLYRSRLLRDELQPPTNLGTSVNTAAHELDPALSMNGFGLDFSSDRLSAGQVAGAAREYRLYHTNSREVFSETQRLDRPPIDWAALWRAVGPNLLWALLALALLALMLLLFKGGQNRKLSLLAKCILASLAAHLLLMLLFNVWEVAASLAGEFQRGGAIKVALMGPASHSISAQLTGSLSEVSAPEIEVESTKASPIVENIEPSPPSDIPPVRKAIEFAHAPLTATRADESSTPQPAPPIPEIAPSTPAARTDIPLEVPATVATPPISEPPMQAQPARATAARANIPESAVTTTVPQSMSQPLPPRTAIAQSQSAVRLAVDQIREAQLDQATESPANPPLQPAVTLPKLALASRMPAAPTRQPRSEEQAVVSPSLALAATQRQTLDAASTTAPADHQVAQDLAPPPGRIDVPPSKSIKEFGSQVADSVAAAPGISEAPAAAPDFPAKSAQAMQLALPDATGSPVAHTDAPPDEHLSRLPSRAPSLARADLPLAQSPAVASGAQPAFQLARANLNSKSEPTLAIPNKAPSDVSAAHDQVMDERRVALSLPAPTPATIDLSLPTELVPPENPYPQRTAEDRLENVKRLGGSEKTEAAVALALEWLARHQSPDGHWDADGFDARCGDCGGETKIAADHALTGLGLLCFLGAGHTHAQPGQYQDNVQRALSWLIAKQKSDGDLRGGKETMYTQGIATIALAESYAMTADAKLADPVQRAVGFIHRARNPQAGGWRYDPGQAGDTSVLGWQVMALKSAARAGIPVPESAFAHARDWLDRASRDSEPGLYSYQPGEGPSPSMTAEGLFAQQLLGLTPTEPRMLQSVDFVLDHLPDWDREAPTYFWYYASLALFQHQGDAWRTWNAAISTELIDHQRRDGRAAGSWDPSDDWSRLGGRVYQTALCTLMLEVYYRYLPMYGQDALAVQSAHMDAPEELVGVIRGTVTNKSTGAPLASAQVRLVLSDRDTLTAITGSDGKYTLEVPATPDFFALSASLDPFVPKTISVERARLEAKRKLVVNFALEPESQNALVTEAAPDVHHLGDDRFSGSINSQFQKKSEGAKFSISFEIASEALAHPLDRAEVRLMAKGVQRRHKVFVNDRLLQRRLDDAPDDGGFGEFIAPFDPALLTAGTNTLRIEALPSDDDIDDFEFVNIRIYLVPPPGPDLGTGTSFKLESGTSGTQ